jgi:exopolyphosphatase / guanosine-5'-triphosphate,3'-diphosphate pyrophosphatase
MSKIIPRWEWRTFGDDLSKGEEEIEKCGTPRNRESSEIYILSAKSNDNTKIRDELMDIKSPIRINKDTGLEQWTVLAKSAFPIHINDLVLVYKAFGLQLPYLNKDEYSYQEYIEELIGKNPDLKMVNVEKIRHGYLIDEAIVEIAEVKFNDFETKTIAVEHTDPELVLKTVKKLGLTEFENINYIKAMKRAFGMKY